MFEKLKALFELLNSIHVNEKQIVETLVKVAGNKENSIIFIEGFDKIIDRTIKELDEFINYNGLDEDIIDYAIYERDILGWFNYNLDKSAAISFDGKDWRMNNQNDLIGYLRYKVFKDKNNLMDKFRELLEVSIIKTNEEFEKEKERIKENLKSI